MDDDEPSEMDVKNRISRHRGHDPSDPRVKLIEELAGDRCGYCAEGRLRWQCPSGMFAHACPTHHEADECEAHNILVIAMRHGVPIYTGADLEFPEE